MNSIKKIFSLEGRVALITGGAGMLAGTFAEILSEAGANVVLLDLNETEIKKRAGNITKESNKKTLAVKVDITKEKEVEDAVKSVINKFGKIDILINNAALNPQPQSLESKQQFLPLEDYPLELWKKELDVNLTGMFLCSKIIGHKMAKQGGGVIINISSTYGVVAPDQRIYPEGKFKSIGYSSTKSAVLNFTRHLASYWKDKNIRVNALVPGGVFAGQDENFVKNYSYRTMLGRMANKDEYKGAILFLASDASSYMTGSMLVVDGGWTAW